MNTSSPQVRANAALALDQVISKNRTIDWIENKHPNWMQAPVSREITFGSLRYLNGLKAACDEHLDRPLRAKDSSVYALLIVGAYQLHFMKTPKHAAINETVAACKLIDRPWASKLANAILRKIAKTERSFDLMEQLHSHLRPLLENQFSQDPTELANALLSRAPMTLRVNTRVIAADAYADQLTQAGIPHKRAWFPETIVLDQPMPSRGLPGYAQGEVAIQDGGAQWAHYLLFGGDEVQSSSCYLLDACSAPGGKLFHSLEQSDGRLNFVALELEPSRTETMQQIAQRLGHDVRPMVGNASQDNWWDGKPFSHILLDAPCSGTGTIRRHPDINVLFRKDRLANDQQKQLSMLNNLWPMLQPGGSLLYCTCSLLEQENDQVIEAFVNQQEGEHRPTSPPSVQTLSLPTGQRTRFGWQLLPIDPLTDGFYFSLLHKPAS